MDIRSPRLWSAAAAAVIVAAEVFLSLPRLHVQFPDTVITWLVVVSFVAVGLALFATDVPNTNGWACLLVAAAIVPGELNGPTYARTIVSPLGFVLEPLYLAATVALVLRYPGPRLERFERILVGSLIVTTSGVRILTLFARGSLPDQFRRPPGWPALDISPGWHDWVLIRFGSFCTIVLLLLTAALLLRRVFTASGLTRQSQIPLAIIGAICGLSSAVDQAMWMLDLTELRWAAPALIRNLSAAAIPVALLADLLRRRSAGAAISARVLPAAQSGDLHALQSALREVLVDPTVELAVPLGESGWVDADGRSVAFEPNAALVIDEIKSQDGSRLLGISHRLAVDDSVWKSARAAVRLGAENLRLNAELLTRMAELRESRARIVEAGLTERRRLERDLHDGAQQGFLTVAASLARVDMVGDDQLREVVSEARAGLSNALKALRDLARGIHPSLLNHGGLPDALADLCARSQIPVILEVEPGMDRSTFPSPLKETAAYFFVAEALANATRHSQATQISVHVDNDREEGLQLAVNDDGNGATRIVPGGGLAGLRDRIEGVGGSLEIHIDPCPDHPSARGTLLRAKMP